MALETVILEDNEDRRRAMLAGLRDRFAQYPVRFFATAAEMMWYLRRHIDDVLVIGLDHDLDMVPVTKSALLDPGTGRDVADYLATQPPTCPVVIHSTNVAAVIGIEQLLRDAGWQTTRVVPYGDLEWIDEVWLRALRDAIVGTAVPAAEAVPEA